MGFRGPLDPSAAIIAELVLEEYLSFTVFAEEAFLLLEFLGHGDTGSPRFSLDLKRSDMLLCAAVGSKFGRFSCTVSQHYSKSLRAARLVRWCNTKSSIFQKNQVTLTCIKLYPVAPFGNGWFWVESCSCPLPSVALTMIVWFPIVVGVHM